MSTQLPPVVLIHGMWMTRQSWTEWVDHYADRGHRTLAPGWPGVTDPVQTRRNAAALKGLGLLQIVDHYDEIVRGLDRPPVIIGHSFGGLVTQHLLNRGLGSSGVAIGTAPPNGVLLLPLSTLRAGFPALKNPFNRNGLAPLTQQQFHWRFTNTLGRPESDAIYEQQYIPGTNRPFFDAVAANAPGNARLTVDFRNPRRPPLLLVYGTEDRISPPSLNRKLVALHQRAPSATSSKEYAGRPHFMAGMEGWREIADHALEWALHQSGAQAGPAEGPSQGDASRPKE